MYRAGFVGLVGFPNAGKSTLNNCLTGERVSIVSAKPQTTRRRVNGILTQGDFQLVFVDSPGFVEGSNELNQFLNEEALGTLEDVDVALFLLPLNEVGTPREERLLGMMAEFKKPKILVITKADLKIEKDLGHLPESKVLVSAERAPDETLKLITDAVQNLVPEADAPLYDPEMYTTQSAKELAAEIVREKCFTSLEKEVPYQLAVNVRLYEEGKKLDRIECEIWVSREGQRGIVIGQAGKKLKKIGSEARRDIEKILGKKIFLGLHVSHKANWMRAANLMKDLGYVAAK
jgi:GTP-binding protein Era